ncbi:MAG: hypothetical protein O9342_14645 [Beijerinckiaceae bacterium]|nr:hypothetical protein [Beijerinckiaceae bacterium]
MSNNSKYSRFRCWEISSNDGAPRVAGVCERCGLVHIHGAPEPGRELRQPHCWGSAGLPPYFLDVQTGKVPRKLRRAMRLPIGDLIIARKKLSSDMDGLVQLDDGSVKAIPTRESVHFAIDALNRCNDCRTASNFKAEIQGALARHIMRHRGHEFWLDARGIALRHRLIGAIDRCIARGGGPFKTSELER